MRFGKFTVGLSAVGLLVAALLLYAISPGGCYLGYRMHKAGEEAARERYWKRYFPAKFSGYISTIDVLRSPEMVYISFIATKGQVGFGSYPIYDCAGAEGGRRESLGFAVGDSIIKESGEHSFKYLSGGVWRTYEVKPCFEE